MKLKTRNYKLLSLYGIALDVVKSCLKYEKIKKKKKNDQE